MNTNRPFPHVAIRASAGSGKTFQLTNRYIALILEGESPDRILATTFTRKAAGEILSRVLTRLAESVLDPAACVKLGQELEVPTLTHEQAARALIRTTRSLHRVQISTIDAFFAGIAKSFSLEIGFPPQWEIVDESVADALRLDAVGATLQGEIDAVVTLIRLLSKGDYDRSVASLVREKVSELHDIFLDAPDSAWHALSPATASDPVWIDEILRQLDDAYASAATMPGRMSEALYKDIEAARAGRWGLFLSRGLARKVLEGAHEYYKQPIPEEIDDLLASLIEQIRAVMMESLIARGDAMHRLLSTFDEHLRELQRARAALRFGDVTRALSTASLLGRLDDVFFRLDSQIHHLLLDEFQDTSLAQWQVLRPLSKEVASHATGERSVFLVGDVKQAIYGWRGGVADIFDTLDGDLPGLSWKPLNCSYRSSPPIISAVNYVFENLQGNRALSDEQAAARKWQEGFRKHKTAMTELKGYVRLEVAPEPEEGEDHYPCILRRAAEIAAQWAHRCPGASIGVLTRRNDAVRRLIHELRRRDVRASEEGGNPITDSVAVSLILSLMRLADHPGDSIARFHVANSPLGEGLGLRDGVRSAAEVSLRVRRELMSHGYGGCVLRWSALLAPYCDAREARRLTQLVRLAHRHDGAPTLRADDFVAFAQSERVEDPASADVRVMTIHKAKGLEFDIVVLPELDGRLVGRVPAVLVESPTPTSPPTKVVPYAREEERAVIPELSEMAKRWRAGQVRESLCSLYVALTRPVHALVMVISSKEPKISYPSTFAGLLRSSLAQGASPVPGKVLFESGDESWYRGPEAAVVTAGAVESIEPIRMRPSASRSRGLPRTSPSALEGGAQIQLSDMMRLDTGAMRKGSIIHALFEQVEWLDVRVPTTSELSAAAQAAGARGDQAPEAVAEFRRMLAHPEVERAMMRSSYDTAELRAEAYRELPFALRDDKSLLTGAMDRVVVRRFGDVVHDVEVLDFKTDGVDEETLEAKVDHYRPQLEAYRRAASRVFAVELERVRARLVFVRAGRVAEVG
jgi:ATP-dependent exoDNAse (exonuclease V) beta subunit